MDFSIILISITLAASLILYIYKKLLEKYSFWKRKSIVYLKPLPIIGNMLPVIQLKSSIGDIFKDAYQRYPKEKVIGVYSFFDPILIVRDQKLIEKIITTDFSYFADQVTIANDGGLFSRTLFQLKGNTWRTIRYKLNNCFTINKLKIMFNQMLDCTDELLNNIEENLNKNVDIKEQLAKFNTDIIANCVFGIKLDKTGNKIFSEMNSAIFDIKPLSFIRIIMILNFPKFSNILGLTFMPKNVDTYMRELIGRTFEQRKMNDRNQRNDYVQHLLDIKEKRIIESHIKDDLDKLMANKTDNIEITDDLLDGQAFQFLAGGFDPINNAMTFAMYEFARHPDIQENIRKEVKEIIAKHGEYNFQSIKEMTYLENCIQETLRFYPLLPFLFRECTKPYITEDGLKIDKGQKIAIPVSALHMDPQHYPDPQKFNPHRFDDGINNCTYLPFGGGPRICLGRKFAMVEMKLGLAKIIEKYKFTLSAKTKQPIEINKQAFLVKPKNEIYLIMSKV